MATAHDEENRALKEALLRRMRPGEPAATVDVFVAEFDGVRYLLKDEDSSTILLSVHLPQHTAATSSADPAEVAAAAAAVIPPELATSDGLPSGAMDAVNAAYRQIATVLTPPSSNYHLTLMVDLKKLPEEQQARAAIAAKLAAVRSVVMGAPLRAMLTALAEGGAGGQAKGAGGEGAEEEGAGSAMKAIVHRPGEVFFASLSSKGDRVKIIFPVHFHDPSDAILAAAFLQELAEARKGGGLSWAPECAFSRTLPADLDGAPAQYLTANVGFVTMEVGKRHVEGPRAERVAWHVCSFHSFVAHHVRRAKGLMHTRMRRRGDALNQMLHPELQQQQQQQAAGASPGQSPLPGQDKAPLRALQHLRLR
ncbi:hypothetical protein CLOM_g5508 [Closterium sp. NIES-68]|nr:hypothetical protein CLOM_g5508 [Closterium sp. NIES-68]GJP69358.1 hypothetical protein CLOP_g293 [Closterium sp. NIES-67]